MNKKYQVFVSSTYSDLVDERQAVSRAILDMGHIPAGMEMFPAADVEQLTYIKKVIDECDYYVLILGARYGSLDEDGVSYTQREYEYARDTAKTILAFVHRDIDNIPLGKTDKNDAKRQKLVEFTDLVKTGRLIQFWDSALELRANAIVSLQKAFSESPQVGWVRANKVATNAAMSDIIRYRNENDELKKTIATLRGALQPKFDDVADLKVEFKVRYKYYSGGERSGSRQVSYGDLLVFMAPTLHTPSTAAGAELALKKAFVDRLSVTSSRLSLNSSDVQDLLMHLNATGHVKMYQTKTMDGAKHVTAYQLTATGIKYWQEHSYTRVGDTQDEEIPF